MYLEQQPGGAWIDNRMAVKFAINKRKCKCSLYFLSLRFAGLMRCRERGPALSPQCIGVIITGGTVMT